MNTDPIHWSPGVTLDEIEKMVILKALSFYRNHKAMTASALGIAIRTLDNKLDKYEFEDEKQRKKLEDERKQKSEFAIRQRGNPPNNIGATFDPLQSQAYFQGAPSRSNVESPVKNPTQSEMPLPKRQEVQKLLPSDSPVNNKSQKR